MRQYSILKRRDIVILLLFIGMGISMYIGFWGLSQATSMKIGKWIPKPLAVLDLFSTQLIFIAIGGMSSDSRILAPTLAISIPIFLLVSSSLSKIGAHSSTATYLTLWLLIGWLIADYMPYARPRQKKIMESMTRDRQRSGIRKESQANNLEQTEKEETGKDGGSLMLLTKDEWLQLILGCLMITLLQVLGCGMALANENSYSAAIKEALIICGFAAFLLSPIFILFPQWGAVVYILEAIYLLIALFLGSRFSFAPFFFMDIIVTLGFVLLFIIPPFLLGLSTLKLYSRKKGLPAELARNGVDEGRTQDRTSDKREDKKIDAAAKAEEIKFSPMERLFIWASILIVVAIILFGFLNEIGFIRHHP